MCYFHFYLSLSLLSLCKPLNTRDSAPIVVVMRCPWQPQNENRCFGDTKKSFSVSLAFVFTVRSGADYSVLMWDMWLVTCDLWTQSDDLYRTKDCPLFSVLFFGRNKNEVKYVCSCWKDFFFHKSSFCFCLFVCLLVPLLCLRSFSCFLHSFFIFFFLFLYRSASVTVYKKINCQTLCLIILCMAAFCVRVLKSVWAEWNYIILNSLKFASRDIFV